MDQINRVLNPGFNPFLADASTNIRREIDHIEGVLDALLASLTAQQQHTEEIQAETDQERASIAPIQKLHSDILSLIFIACSQNEWHAPQMIGPVCRFWRNVLLSTPRAWAYIHLNALSQTQRELWATRSCEVVVHALDRRRDHALVQDIGIKTEKLGTLSLYCGEKSWATILLGYFPHLTALKLVRWAGPNLEPSESSRNILAKSNFPSLKELYLSGLTTLGAGLFVGEGLPPLEDLCIANTEGITWIQVVESVAKSLTSLELWLGPRNCLDEGESPLPVCLPQLVYLRFETMETFESRRSFFLPVNLQTPRLRTYHERSLRLRGGKPSPIHWDVSSVCEAFIVSTPSYVDFSDFRALEQLTISSFEQQPWADALCRVAPHGLPHLRRVHFRDRPEMRPLDSLKEAQERYKLAGRYWELVCDNSLPFTYNRFEWVRTTRSLVT